MIQKLSVVIITFNEEKNIAACLEAAWKVADEIIVVDSYSTDRTKEICIEKGAIFIENPFEGHIQQKNYAITQAKYDNILSLDADEIISPQLSESINKVKNNWIKDAYYLYRRSYYCGRFINHGDWYPDRKIRLFKKTSGNWSGINPHDTFILLGEKSLGKLDGNLEHYTFNSVGEHLEQARKFSRIGSNELIKVGKRVHYYHLLLHPSWRFIRSYLLRFGFLDGLRGFTIASIIALETYLKYLQVFWPVKKHPFHEMSVLHMLSIKHWRGGEQQVAYLVDQLNIEGIFNHLVVSRGSELEKHCKRRGIAHSSIVFGNGFNLFAAWRIKRMSKRLQVDIVHMHCSPSHTLAIFANLLGNKAKMVLSRRVIFPVRQNTFSNKKFNFPGIERIICVSTAIQDVLEKNVQRTDIFRIVYDGIDTKSISKRRGKISVREEFNLQNKKIVVIVAALSPEKDHITFLNLATLILKQDKNFHFLIVGIGKEKNNIISKIKTDNLTDNVTLTGFRNDVPDILMESDYFVLTSTQEGLGSSILEAFANRVPVIATNVGGIPELVLHKTTGMLAGVNSPEQMAEYIFQLEADQGLKETILEGATNHLESNFRIETTARKTAEIYEELVFS